ncbi:MAG: GGDEF domain-containing protein, partial [Epsilonproteobacteria bacterium]
MQNIDIFPWNEHFNTGIKTIDEQHRNLVDIINRLAKHVALDSESVELNTIFDELIEYTVYHFQAEEEIWHKYLPDDTLDADHKIIHQQFVTKVLEFKAEQENKENSKLTKDILLYLAKWLASHILESDRYLAYVVLAVEDGLNLHQAKAMADERMKELTQVLTEVILSIYSALSSNTMDLIHEMKAHDSVALALKKKKEELETIFNTSKDGIAILDLDANFLDANRAYLEMTGYDLEELLTKSCYELSLPEDRTRAVETIKSVVQKGFITNFEKTFVVNNSKNIIINMSFAMMPDKKRIIVSTKDVSEYKEQERKLQYVAHYDIITGLPNRVLLSDRLQQVMSHSRRNQFELAVVYLDLDGFKIINDL